MDRIQPERFNEKSQTTVQPISQQSIDQFNEALHSPSTNHQSNTNHELEAGTYKIRAFSLGAGGGKIGAQAEGGSLYLWDETNNRTFKYDFVLIGSYSSPLGATAVISDEYGYAEVNDANTLTGFSVGIEGDAAFLWGSSASGQTPITQENLLSLKPDLAVSLGNTYGLGLSAGYVWGYTWLDTVQNDMSPHEAQKFFDEGRVF